MTEIAESPAAPVSDIPAERDKADASNISQAATAARLVVRRDEGEPLPVRRASGDGQARLPVGNARGQAPTPEELRAALSREYPRLDIRLGRTNAHPWEAKDSAPISHGWINENGEIVPFDS